MDLETTELTGHWRIVFVSYGYQLVQNNLQYVIVNWRNSYSCTCSYWRTTNQIY